MTETPSRQTLESTLIHHQQTGDFAAQAEVLVSLAKLAWRESIEEDMATHNLATGLYGQAYAAYEQIGDKRGMAHALAEIFYMAHDLDVDETLALHARAVQLYGEVGDFHAQANLYLDLARSPSPDMGQGAYEQALLCYEAAGDKSNQAVMLQELYRYYDHTTPEAQQLANRAIDLYRQLGDMYNEAGVYYMLSLAWGDHDYHTAKMYLDTAYTLYQQVGQADVSFQTLFMDLARQHRDYVTYRRAFDLYVPSLQTLDEKMTHWMRLADLAAECGEFAVSREAYQRCVVIAVQQGLGGEILRYWAWGRMEFFQSGRREMGIALCQWVVTLMKGRYGLPSYQKDLAEMRREMTR